jgi:PAS domain S-box-containing protein
MLITEPEVLSQVLMLVAALGGLGWVVFGLKFNISRNATLLFGMANLLLVCSDLMAMGRASNISFFAFYQTFSVADLMILASTMLFRSGMRDLYGLRCTSARDYGVVALTVLAALAVAHAIGLRHAAGVGVYLAASGFAFKGALECAAELRKSFGRDTRWHLLWPIVGAGVLFALRALDDTLSMMHHAGELSDTMKDKHLARYLWAQLLVLILLNASLIGQTLTALIKRLNDQTQRLQTILDAAPVGVAVSTDGIIRFANPRLTELVDMQVGDVASKALVLPETREKIVTELKQHGTVSDMEVQMFCPHHTPRDLLVTYMPIEYEGKAGILGWMIDITERKRDELRLRQASDEQSAIFESATMGIAFIKDWTIVRANHRLAELFGCALEDLIGQSAHLWYSEGGGMDEGPYEDILRGAIHNSTQQMTRKDGSLFWCRLSGSAIDPQDLGRGTVWMFDDVSDERRASELMRQARDLAEEATRMKSDFLANMSHEIRTPMNAIIGMAHLALQTDLNPRQRNYIEKVDSAGRNLLGIINDILDFSKIEAGKMRFEVTEFHLEDVMETLADVSVLKAQDKGLELLFDIGPEVPTSLVGDPLRLGQVLINLVGNAVKFTERGEVTVGIHVAQATPEPGHICLRFDVTDTGVGLSEEQQERLFSAFSQADASTTRKYGGTGLGLTICKRLVELMDGEIGVRSQPGQGSTFTFTAHFSLQAEQFPRTTLDAADTNGLRILVVDDNARAREIMLAILASQKFDAQAVPGGVEAIAALEAAQAAGRPFGLVLMDWMMPDMDGLATIQRIRADTQLHGIPAFVMVTAHSRDEFMEQADGTRIDGLLLKPVSPSALFDSILCALGKEVVTRGRKQRRQEANLEAQQAVRGAHLLLVEDNPVNQELALELLQGAGIRVDVANNGAEAVAQVTRHAYDGVLMDCQMPVMDGFEATRRIRADGRHAKLPILAMTANAMSGDREQCLAAGMNDHIAKPIDVNQLFTSLARWVHPAAPQATEPAGTPAMPVAAQADVLPAVAGLNLAQATRRMGGNAKLVRKLMQRFADTQADAVARIQKALEEGDHDTALREAHTTKGLAGNIGALQVLERAADLEHALRHGPPTTVQPALDVLATELQGLLTAMATALPQPGGAGASERAPVVDRVALEADLAQLAAYLQDDDARAAKLVDSLTDKLRGVGQSAAAAQLQRLVAKYEYEDALRTLTEAAQALNMALAGSGQETQ